jgi:glycosyltransferase involved in cell wall biosynthesis
VSRVPRVSVVVPTYNGSSLLVETLETVLAQTMEDFELIVVDDGSTDDTRDRLAAISDPRLRVVTQENRGIGAARSRCLDEARAPLVALLDHDDLWHPKKLELQVEFLEKHPECVGVTVPWSYSDRPDQPVFDPHTWSKDRPYIPRPLRRLAEGHLIVMSSSLVLNRARLGALRYPSIRGTMEDGPFYLRLFSKGALGLVGDTPLMIYRHHANNASHQALYFLRGIEFLRKLEEQDEAFEPGEVDRRDGREYIAFIGRMALMRLLAERRLKSALGLYFREWPHQAKLGRLKFLAGFPAAWLAAALRPHRAQEGSS